MFACKDGLRETTDHLPRLPVVGPVFLPHFLSYTLHGGLECAAMLAVTPLPGCVPTKQQAFYTLQLLQKPINKTERKDQMHKEIRYSEYV